MKKLINQIKNKVTFFNFFLMATLFGIIILLLSVGINYKYTKDTTRFFEQKQIEIEYEIQNLNLEKNDKNNSVIKNMEVPKNKKDFMKEYYEIQADWLNKWLTALAIIMAVLGIMIPICFVKFLENKEKEMNRIIKEAQEQKDKTEINVREMAKQIEEVNKKSEKIENDLETVKEYAKRAESFAKYSEALRINESKHKENEKAEKVKQLIKEAFELNNSSPQIIEAMAMEVYYKDKKYNEGIKLIKDLLKTEKNDKYYEDLSRLYEKSQQYKESVKSLDNAIEYSDNDSTIQYYKTSKALIYIKMNKNTKAKEIVEEVMQVSSKFSNIRSICAVVYVYIGDYSTAIKILEEQYSIRKNPVDMYNLIEAYIFNENFDRALECLSSFIQIKNPYVYSDDKDKWNKKLQNAEQSETVIKTINLIEELEEKERDD